MNKVFCISRYELKMQIKRLSGWLVLLFALAVSLLDNFPSATNLARLEFLSIPSYFVQRVLGQPGLILLFGFMFVLSSRIRSDQTSYIKELFMVAPISKAQYILGKLIGNFLYELIIMIVFLTVNITLHFLFNPEHALMAAYITPFMIGFSFVVLPACFFVAACAVMLPVLIDIRLFYLLFSVLFIINAITVGSAAKMPFYLITAGDLSKVIWLHPKFPILYVDSMVLNLVFLLGIGLMATFLVFIKRNFWRAV